MGCFRVLSGLFGIAIGIPLTLTICLAPLGARMVWGGFLLIFFPEEESTSNSSRGWEPGANARRSSVRKAQKNPEDSIPWRKEKISEIEFEYKEIAIGYIVRLNGVEHKFVTVSEIVEFINSQSPGQPFRG